MLLFLKLTTISLANITYNWTVRLSRSLVGHCLADGRWVIRAADEQWWIVNVIDGHDHGCRRLKLNPNETDIKITVTFSAKIERFTNSGVKISTAKIFKKIAAKSPWDFIFLLIKYHGRLIVCHGSLGIISPWNYTMISAIAHGGVISGKCRICPGKIRVKPLGFYFNPEHGSFTRVPHGTLREGLRYKFGV